MARTIIKETTDTERLDTNIFNTITGDSSQPVAPSLGTTSTKSAGIVKVVNIFIKLMYTLKGSNFLDKAEGTFFVNLFHYNINDLDVAKSKVQNAMDDAFEQIQKTQAATGVPDTEKVSFVTITNLTQEENGDLDIEITLGVESGATTAIQLPSTTLES